jgi:hypothetical protein
MKSWRLDPYLWIHLAGLAALPLFLGLTWLALGIGYPLPLYWLELAFLLLVGIFPVFWMQWTRPFDIYSLLVVALKPEKLTQEQLKILSLMKNKKQRLWSLIAALLMIGIFWKLYEWAPLSDLSSGFLPQNRILGLFLASLAILASHLFLQVPLAVISVLLTPGQEWEITPAFTPAEIRESFTLLGWKVDKIISESAHATSQIP